MSKHVAALLTELRKKNIFIQLKGEKLKVNAPPGVLTADIKAELKTQKESIIEFLKSISLRADESISLIDRSGELLQSPAQERLWFLHQLQPNASYNMAKALTIQGPLNVIYLEQAFQFLVSRHESLRTHFASNEQGEAIQLIDPQVDLKLKEVDLSALAESEQRVKAEALTLSEAQAHFDLACAPLIRCQLIKLSENRHLLLLTLHHIICDGWSLGVLVRDVMQRYTELTLHRESSLAPLSVQYADFSSWQRQRVSRELGEKQLEYWKQTLTGAADLLNLPTDKARPAQQSFRGATRQFSLSSRQSVELREFARQHDITLFMLLLAGFQLLLGRLSQQDDVSVGVPVAGREHPQLQPLIGFFINALILRGDMRGNPSVEEYLQRVRKLSLGAFEHQDIPMEEVLKHLKLRRNAAFNPGAQVGFSWQAGLMEASVGNIGQTVTELDIEAFEVGHSTTVQDMTLSLWESEQGIEGRVEYATDLFEDESIAQFIESYRYLLGEIVRQPGASIHGLALLPEEALIEHLGMEPWEVEAVYPLTPMQEDIYLDATINPGSCRNSIGYCARFTGEADMAVWQRAVNQLVNAEAMLRTECVVSGTHLGERVYQVVKRHKPQNLRVLDWRGEKLDEAMLLTRLQKVIQHPWDISDSTLFTHYLVLASDTHYFIAAASHHLNSDGAGMSAHGQKWLACYEAQLLGSRRVADTSKGFLQQVESIRKKTDRRETLAFWQDKFEHVEPLVFAMPSQAKSQHDKPQRIIKSLALSQTHWREISEFCRRRRIVPALYIKVLYAWLLKQYCRAGSDFEITEFNAGRNKNNFMALGIYYEQRPFILRAESLSGDQCFDDLLTCARDFQKNSKKFHPLSISAKRRIFQGGSLAFTYNYFNFPQSPLFDGQALDTTLFRGVVEQAVQFVVSQDTRGVSFNLEYQDDCFLDYDFLERLNYLSEQVVAKPGLRLSEFDLLLPFEQEELFNSHKLNQRPLSAEPCVQRLFEQQVKKTPDACALKYRDLNYSYDALNQGANSLAHYLRHEKMGRNQLIAICLPPGFEMITALLGVIKSGAAYLPLDISYPSERIRYILKDSQAVALLTLTELAEENKLQGIESGFSGKVFYLDALKEIFNKGSIENPVNTNNKDDLLYVIYTSGSTGKPKGAGIKHRGELNLLQWYEREFEINKQARVMMLSAFGFDLTQKNLLVPLVSGGQLIIPDGEFFDAEKMATQLEAHGVTLVNCAPSVFYSLLEFSSKNSYTALNSLQTVILGGEVIQMDRLFNWLSQANCQAQITNNYGPTECTDIAAFFRVIQPADYLEKAVPVGRANDNVTLYLVNEDQQLLPRGLTGELYISGEGVGSGYLNNKSNQYENGHERFDKNPYSEILESGLMSNPDGLLRWYRSGDLMRYLPDGNLEFVGRKDFQVKVRGLRIEPGEVEWALQLSPLVESALVLAHENRLIAFIIKSDGADNQSLEAWNWRVHLRKYLPESMLPSQLTCLKAWPLTPNGKIDRNALPLLSGEQERDYIAPRNPVEQALADIWAEVLGLDQVGIEDNFFEIGGHSLLATRIVSRCRQRFQVELPLRELFESPTVATLARLIETVRGKKSAPAIERRAKNDLAELSFAQQRLWFVDKLNPGSVAYLMPSAFKISGKLGIERFTQALRSVVARHDILRTNFIEEEGVLQQHVGDANNWQLNFIDLNQDKNKEEKIKNLIKENSNGAMDLSLDPLFKVCLVKISESEFVLIACLHHIISDGWSFSILLQELAFYYGTENQQALPVLPVQYADYSLWQRNWLQGEVLQQHIDFWCEYLADAPAVLNLPADRPRPVVQSFEGKNYHFSFEPTLVKQLKAGAEKEQISLFMLLLGAYVIQLSRYSAQQDICVGLPVSGRDHAPTEHLIGLFLNVIVLRTKFEGNPTQHDYLQQIKHNLLNCFEYQDLPAEILLEQLNLERSLSYSPVAQVGFQLQNFSELGELPAFSGLEMDALSLERVSSKYDMTFILREQGDQLTGVVEYSTALYDESRIVRFVEHYKTLLTQMMAAPALRINQLQLIKAAAMPAYLGLPEAVAVRPLSHMQRDLLLVSQAEPETLANCFGGCMIMPASVDGALLKQALYSLAAQSSVLRTRLCPVNEPWLDSAYQIVYSDAQIDWETRESLHFESRAALDTYVQNFVFRPYAIEGLLLRCQLVSELDATYLILAAHHVLLDGMGVASLVSSLLEVYEGLLAKQNITLPEEYFPLYLQKEAEQVDTPEAIQYWREKLLGTAALSQHKSSAVAEVDGNDFHRDVLSLDDAHWQNVKLFCRQHRITPALYFKGLYGLLIRLYCSADEDFSIYEISADLLSMKSNAMGCTIQRRPFIFELFSMQGDQSIDEYFKRLREEQRAIHKSGFHTSIHMQKSLVPEGRLSFMYNYYHFTREFEVAGHRYETLLFHNDVEQVHLIVNFKLGKLSLGLHYHGQQFQAMDFIERLVLLSEQVSAERFLATDEFAESSSRLKLNQLNYLFNNEKLFLDNNLIGPEKTLEQSRGIYQQFIQQLEKHSEKIAVQQGDKQLSYQDLYKLSNRLAFELKVQGVKTGSRVGICLSRSPDLMVALLAVIKIGAVYVPIDANFPKERVRYILNDAEVDVVVSTGLSLSPFADLVSRPVLLDKLSEENNQSLEVVRAIDTSPDALFYIIYTSGSTGQAKGAAIKQLGVLNLLDWYMSEFDFSVDTRHLVISAFGFDLTQKNLWAPLLSGGCIYFPLNDEFNPRQIIQQIKKQQIQVINCAPSTFYEVLAQCEGVYSTLASLRLLILGGEPIVMDKLRSWLASESCQAQLVNNYGPTECTDIAAFHRIESLDTNIIPIGKPCNNVQLQLLNDTGQAVPPGMMGELCISGAGVGAGYLNKAALSELVFQKKINSDNNTEQLWYHSGDMMCLLPDGNLEFIGRKDFQIKLRGLRIESQEVETALRKIDGVEDSLVRIESVFSSNDEHKASGDSEVLIAYVVGEGSLNECNWHRLLAEYLPAYMIPAQVLVLKCWPLGINGKIDRSALPNWSARQVLPFVAPRNDIERQLAAIWCEVIGLPKIGIWDNFFAAGGHSLLAVRIMARMEKQFQHKFPLSLLFRAQNIADLGEIVQRRLDVQSGSPVILIKAAQLPETFEQLPPLFLIHPGGGGLLCYQALADALAERGPARAIYGLQCPGLESDEPVLRCIEDMAASYIQAIQKVYPQGPYLLAGQSLGGNIAWEMAQQLREEGKTVSLLCLIDSYVPQFIPESYRQQDTLTLLQRQFEAVLSVDWQALGSVSDAQQVETLYHAAQQQGLLTPDFSLEQIQRFAEVIKANAEALLAYQARTYTGHVLLVEAMESELGIPSSTAWADLVSGKLESLRVAADHQSVLEVPAVTELAEWLDKQLQKLGGKRSDVF